MKYILFIIFTIFLNFNAHAGIELYDIPCDESNFTLQYQQEHDRVSSLIKKRGKLEKAADNGDSAALFQVGYNIYYSRSEHKKLGLSLMELASNSDSVFAKLNLLRVYYEEKSENVPYDKVINTGKLIAMKGSTYAQSIVPMAMEKLDRNYNYKSILSLSVFDADNPYFYIWLLARQGDLKSIAAYLKYMNSININANGKAKEALENGVYNAWEYQVLYGRLLLLNGWSNKRIWLEAKRRIREGVDNPNNINKIGLNDMNCLDYYMSK